MIEALKSFRGKKIPIFISHPELKKEVQKVQGPFLFSRSEEQAKISLNHHQESLSLRVSTKKIIINKKDITPFFESLKAFIENHQIVNTLKKDSLSISRKYAKKNNIKRFFKNSSEYYQDVIKSLIQTEKIEDLPIKLSHLKVFKSYKSFITISLQKGSSKALICDLGKSDHLEKFYLDSKDFNSIYNAIKKSKGKYFYEHKLISARLKLVGCFLAKVFTLTTHNLIIIISRDDFILPTHHETETFEQFSQSIEKALRFIETKNTLYSHLSLSLSILYELKYYISIYKDNLSIASNSGVQDFSKTFSTLWSQLSIHYAGPELRYINPSLFHYQRIKLMGELFNILKHELSNPIFGIKMSLDILVDGLAQNKGLEILDQLKESSDRSLDILNNMTDIFSVEQKVSEVNFENLFNKVYMLCKSELKFIQYSIQYENEILKKSTITTNVTVASQIIFNLLINAIQELKETYKDPKKRKISVFIKASKNSNKEDLYEIYVTDNGRGIEQEEQEKIFKLFYSKKTSGNGIGLPLSKALANKLGGDLFLKYSQRGETTFCLQIPTINKG